MIILKKTRKNTKNTIKHENFFKYDTNTMEIRYTKYKHEIVESNTRKTENTKFIKKSELWYSTCYAY